MSDDSGDESDYSECSLEELARKREELLQQLKDAEGDDLELPEEELGNGNGNTFDSPCSSSSQSEIPFTPLGKRRLELDDSFVSEDRSKKRRDHSPEPDVPDSELQISPKKEPPAFNSDSEAVDMPSVSESSMECVVPKVEVEPPVTVSRCPVTGRDSSRSTSISSSASPDLLEDIDSQVALECHMDENTEGPKTKPKRVPAYRRNDMLEVMPKDWVEITHASGVPLYLHKPTRVCTFSRPYYLGNGSARHHEVPLCAIPCLHERQVNKHFDEREKRKTETGVVPEGTSTGVPLVPVHTVKTAEDDMNKQLSPEDIYEYANPVFRIKTIQVTQFQRWKETREQRKEQHAKLVERLVDAADDDEDMESVGGGVKRGIVSKGLIITQPLAVVTKEGKPGQRSVLINPIGKTAVNVLHEYVQKMLRGNVLYDFTELRSGTTPYSAKARLKLSAAGRMALVQTIREKLAVLQQLDVMESGGGGGEADTQVIGKGVGSSKRHAKSESAKDALAVLIPGLVFNSEGIACEQGEDGKAKPGDDAIALFDAVPIEDHRVLDMSLRTGVPTPYQILQECLHRNVTYSGMEANFFTSMNQGRKVKCEMVVGEFKVHTFCNKKTGKQMCAQMILHKIHSELEHYGSLLRIYMNPMSRNYESVKAQREVTRLQTTEHTSANQAVLSKLREQLQKVADSRGDVTLYRPPICATRESVTVMDEDPVLSETTVSSSKDTVVKE